MTTQTEALKLALEALENPNSGLVPHKGEWNSRQSIAITAIKEALAQPEQERFHVATIGNWGRIEWVEGIFPSVGDKMYSAPPQRTWVELTDEDQFNLVHAMNENDWDAVQLLEAADAKLRSKNEY